jgi:hypothetical protein
MARRQSRPDPTEAALAGARCLNPHPEQVTDPEFLASEFFGARDAVQVKYEMVRKVRAGGAPVTEAAAAFGCSRPAYYAAAAALESSGLEGLVPARPGPHGARKLTGQILAWAGEQMAAAPGLRPAQLPDRIEEAFGDGHAEFLAPDRKHRVPSVRGGCLAPPMLPRPTSQITHQSPQTRRVASPRRSDDH